MSSRSLSSTVDADRIHVRLTVRKKSVKHLPHGKKAQVRTKKADSTKRAESPTNERTPVPTSKHQYPQNKQRSQRVVKPPRDVNHSAPAWVEWKAQ